MIKKLILTGFMLMILTVSFFALAAYNSEAHATGSTPGDDADFTAEMSEFLRLPDELDTNLDPYSQPEITVQPGNSFSQPDNQPAPPRTSENKANDDSIQLLGQKAEDYNKTSPKEADSSHEDPAVKLARPSDPEPEYPAEPGTLPGKFIDVMEKLLEGAGAVIVGVLVILTLVGLSMVKARKKNAAPAPAVTRETTHPMEQNLSKYCTSCGSRLQPDVLFCTNCGEKI